jgi:hypothetical protein
MYLRISSSKHTIRVKYRKYEDFGYLLSDKYMTNMWTFEKKPLNLEFQLAKSYLEFQIYIYIYW